MGLGIGRRAGRMADGGWRMEDGGMEGRDGGRDERRRVGTDELFIPTLTCYGIARHGSAGRGAQEG